MSKVYLFIIMYSDCNYYSGVIKIGVIQKANKGF